jgi:TPR repeat protein
MRVLTVLCAVLWLSAAATAGAVTPLTPVLQAKLDQAVATYEAGRLRPAQAAFEALARREVPAAEYNLAVMHLRAEVPRPDRALALRLLQRAAGGGFVTAQLMLGRGLEAGEFGPRDLQRAHQWYERAALAGDTDAQVAMGTAFYLGRGRPKEPAQAVHWFREAAKGGDVGAMYLLASMMEQGDGVERDLRLARYWYDAAARSGDPAAPGKVKEIDLRLAAPQ